MDVVRPYKGVSSIGALAPATQSPSQRTAAVAIIGAGYAGLSAALALRDRGSRVVVLEARDRVGGRAWSVPLANGEVVELGGEWIFEGYDEMRRLAGRFGLGLVEMGFDFARREVADLVAPLAGQDALVERLRARVGALSPRELDAMTLGELLDAEEPTPSLRALRARFEGTCAVDLREAGLRPAFDEGMLRSGGHGPSWRLAEGNQALATAIAGEVDVRTGALVTRVEDLGDGVRIHVAGSEPVDAAAAVLAVPLPVVRELRIEPAVPTAVREVLDGLAFGVASKLAVPVGTPLSPRARQSVAGPFWWWVSRGADGARRRVVTAYAGSPAAQTTVDAASGDPATWLERLVALDPEIRPAGDARLVHWGSDPLAGGAYTAIPPGVGGALGALEVPFGRLVLAGEHTAGVAWHGTLEGALRSGARAAAHALALASAG
jgi:monoamine oxidase